MDLDKDDIPHIASRKEVNGTKRIIYTTKKDGRWDYDFVDINVEAGGDTGIALDSKARPHIIYNAYDKEEKRYAVLSKVRWAIKTIVKNAGENESVKISIDNDDMPHVVYNIEDDYDNENLMHAYISSGEWIKEKVSLMGNPAIAIDDEAGYTCSSWSY